MHTPAQCLVTDGPVTGRGPGDWGTPPTFSSRTSSELVEAGFSMATRHSICRRWFCITSLGTEEAGARLSSRPCSPGSRAGGPKQGFLVTSCKTHFLAPLVFQVPLNQGRTW